MLYNNYISSNYLNQCDLINKYSVVTPYDCPSIKKVVATLSFSKINKHIAKRTSKVDSNREMKGLVLSYILFDVDSNIRSALDLSDFKPNVTEILKMDFFHNIVFEKPEHIQAFFRFLFIENECLYSIQKIEANKMRIKTKKVRRPEEEEVNITFKFPLSIFSEYHEFCNNVIPLKEVKLEDLDMTITITVKNVNEVCQTKDLLPLFQIEDRF